MAKNEMLPKIQAEKNNQALEQAKARLEQLRKTFDLKRKAAEADLRILEIRRDKASNAMKMAETNASRMEVRSPIAGLAVIRSMWKSNGQAEILEGEEVRAGMPVVDIVNPAKMRVRVRVNQADITDLRVGQRMRVGLDAYPDLSFGGQITQISPLAVTSTLSPKLRYFIMLAEIDTAHAKLMPDLTASLDVELARLPAALVVPRDAVRSDGPSHRPGPPGIARRGPRRRRRRRQCARGGRHVWPRRRGGRRAQHRRHGRRDSVVKRLATILRRPRNAIVILIVAVVAVAGVFVAVGRGSAPRRADVDGHARRFHRPAGDPR